MRRFIWAFVLGTFATIPSAVGDEIVLRDGRRIEGKLASREEGVVVFDHRLGRLRFPESQIVAIHEGETRIETYEARLAALTPEDVGARLALARWCESVGLNAEAKVQRRAVLELDADNDEAHRGLGHVRHEGVWMSRKEGMRARGLQWYEGAWRTKTEVLHLKRVARLKAETRALRREVDAQLRRLVHRHPATREAARDALYAIAARERLPHLRAAVAKAYGQVGEYWRRVSLDVRTSMTSIVGVRHFQVPLGRGAPVSIQLPEVRSISLGTSVTFPVR